jgi:hypothetical protein
VPPDPAAPGGVELPAADVIISTLPAGAADGLRVPPGDTAVLDVVYAPWPTPFAARAAAAGAQNAHRDVRDRITALLDERKAEPVLPKGGYELPFPVLSAVDAAALAVVLEEGVSAAWVALLDAAADAEVRQLAVDSLGAAEERAVAWRTAAGRTPVTTALPGLPG